MATVAASLPGRMPRTEVGSRIRQLRTRAGETQDQIADALGISQNLVTRIENGLSSPTAEILVQLAVRWHVSVDYLVGLSNYTTALPADAWVIDQDFVEAIESGTWDRHKHGDTGAFPIPRRMRIVSSVERDAIERRLAPLLAKVRNRNHK